jgi:uncharacterized peroxidase-related enzyme
MTEPSFLAEPQPTSEEAQAMFDEDIDDFGFVMNVSRLWAYQSETASHLFDVMSEAFKPSGLDFRHRGLLVLATASTLGDSYCSLAWGYKLANIDAGESAAKVLLGNEADLAPDEMAMVTWARKVVRDPNSTTSDDIQHLRDAGFTDAQIFAITTFVALRMAFSTINDSLGAHPDAQLTSLAPDRIVQSVTYGRSPG